jgi:hypothetical protein
MRTRQFDFNRLPLCHKITKTFCHFLESEAYAVFCTAAALLKKALKTAENERKIDENIFKNMIELYFFLCYTVCWVGIFKI